MDNTVTPRTKHSNYHSQSLQTLHTPLTMTTSSNDEIPYNLLYEDWLHQGRKINAEIARTSASDATRLQALAGHSLVARVGLMGTLQAAGLDKNICSGRLEKEMASETHRKAVRALITPRMEAIIRLGKTASRQPSVLEEADVNAFLEEYPECRRREDQTDLDMEKEEEEEDATENTNLPHKRAITTTSIGCQTDDTTTTTTNTSISSDAAVPAIVPAHPNLSKGPANVYPTMDYQSQHQPPLPKLHQPALANPYHSQYPLHPPPAPAAQHQSSALSWNDQQHGVGHNPFQTATEYARAGGGEPLGKQQNQQQQQQQQQQNRPSHYNPYTVTANSSSTTSNSPPPPPAPMIRESLKRKYQLPIKRSNNGEGHQNSYNSNHTSNNNIFHNSNNTGGGGSGNGQRGGGLAYPTTNNNNTDSSNTEEDELPEPLQRFGKDLVDKIRSEIMDAGETITFHDIAGLEDAKQTVQEVVCWPMKRPDLFTGLRRAPNGLLLYGPPGTGKTLIGKAIAHESGATFFSISSSSLTSKWIGEGEKLVRTLFAVAAYYEPSVVFVDEIDSLLTQRKADENEASRRIKTEFLVQLDGTGTGGQGRVLMIGATNRPQELDEAARRRFTKRLYIPLPEEGDREVLLKVLLEKNKHGLSDPEIQKLAKDTDGFSGADLKALCTDAAMGPIRALGARALEVDCKDVPPIMYKHFRQSLRSMNPSVAPSDLEQYLAWDEMYGNKRAPMEEDTDDDS